MDTHQFSDLAGADHHGVVQVAPDVGDEIETVTAEERAADSGEILAQPNRQNPRTDECEAQCGTDREASAEEIEPFRRISRPGMIVAGEGFCHGGPGRSAEHDDEAELHDGKADENAVERDGRRTSDVTDHPTAEIVFDDAGDEATG